MSAAQQFQVTCEVCPGYELDPRYSRPTAQWEKEFHDDFVHDGDDVAEVQEV